jgi:hypothetical protein
VSEPLHVTNGDSTAHTLEQTPLGGTVLSWRDVLHEGPLRPPARPGFLEARSAFLAAAGWGSAASIAAELGARDDELLVALRSGRPVVLWFEHDLYDQLQLLDVLALVQPAAVPHETLELVQVGSFPGRPGFRGLGELSSRELVTLWPSRVRVTRSLIGDASAVWDDVRAPEPAALAARASASVAGLPFLPAALARLLEELPGPRDGLSRTERQLLHVLADGPRTPAAAFVAAQELEDAPFHGDSWVFRALWELGRGDIRLVETASGERVPEPTGRADGLVESVSFVEQVELLLTPAGRQVLAGEADRVELLGIDRWVGGTHVCPGALWRWDSDRRELLPPA